MSDRTLILAAASLFAVAACIYAVSAVLRWSDGGWPVAIAWLGIAGLNAAISFFGFRWARNL